MNKRGLFLPLLILMLGLFRNGILAAGFNHRELDPAYNIYSELEAVYFDEGYQLDERKDFLNQLVIAKSLLIDGHSSDAILVLEKLSAKTKSYKKKILINHFLALAYFSDANTKQTREVLSQLTENATSYYHNCALRIVSALSLPESQNSEVSKVFGNCSNYNLNRMPYLNNSWLDIVFKQKTQGYLKNSLVRDYLATKNLDIIKMILKYGIYYNHSKQVLTYYDIIPVDYFADPELRTLVAINLYNSGQKDKALKLVQSLNNSNANKVKGLSEATEEKYKGAFSHFFSNLLTKPYSINNNQLILTAAWRSGNYKAAREALAKIPVSESLSREKELLKINLLIKEGKDKQATYLMKNLDLRYNKKLPYEAAILSSYLKLLKNDSEWIDLSDKSCLNKNVVSCWLHMQSKIWENFTSEVIDKEQRMESKVIQDRLNSMIDAKANKDLKGPTLIYQKDIYDLDIIDYPELQKEVRNNIDSQL